jgi:hypothetical protein
MIITAEESAPALGNFPVYYVEMKDTDDEDECPAGGMHLPESEVDSITTEFWGELRTDRYTRTTCAKCGEQCEPALPEEPDRLEED